MEWHSGCHLICSYCIISLNFSHWFCLLNRHGMVSLFRMPSVEGKINWQSRKIGILFKKAWFSKSKMSASKQKKGMRKRKWGDASIYVVYMQLSFPLERRSESRGLDRCCCAPLDLLSECWSEDLNGDISLLPLKPLQLPLKGVLKNAVVMMDFGVFRSVVFKLFTPV